MDTDEQIVTLIDEDGEVFEFLIIDCFTVEGREYAVALPLQEDGGVEEEWGECDEDGDDAEDENDCPPMGGDLEEEAAVIFHLCKGDEGQTSFQTIEDEQEWEKISAIALERLYQMEE